MTIISAIAVPTKTLTVNPTATELDRWRGDTFESGRVTIENLDTSQTMSGWLETRPVYGSGNFGPVGETTWIGIPPLIVLDGVMPTGAVGAGEARFMATASGVGGSVKYTRRTTHTANT